MIAFSAPPAPGGAPAGAPPVEDDELLTAAQVAKAAGITRQGVYSNPKLAALVVPNPNGTAKRWRRADIALLYGEGNTPRGTRPVPGGWVKTDRMAALVSLSVSNLVRSGAPRIRIPTTTGDRVMVRWDPAEVFEFFRLQALNHANR